MDTQEIQDGTVASLVATVASFWTPDNRLGWNNYPVYVECDDGVVRKIRTIGSRIVAHGHKTEQFVYDGGFYLKADV